MFTRERIYLPQLTGDWAIDGPKVLKALNEYLFSLDRPGALYLEEVAFPSGEWTPGVSFGGGTTGITYTTQEGTFYARGNRILATGAIVLLSKGSSTGAAAITGLPYTIKNSAGSYAAAKLHLNKISFANQYQGFGAINTTTITLTEITEAGVQTTLTNADFANDSEIVVTLEYEKA